MNIIRIVAYGIYPESLKEFHRIFDVLKVKYANDPEISMLFKNHSSMVRCLLLIFIKKPEEILKMYRELLKDGNAAR